MQPYFRTMNLERINRKANQLNESFYYRLFNESANAADVPLNDASPMQQQEVLDRVESLPPSLMQKAKQFLKNNWGVLTVGAALAALAGGAIYNRDAIGQAYSDWGKGRSDRFDATTKAGADAVIAQDELVADMYKNDPIVQQARKEFGLNRKYQNQADNAWAKQAIIDAENEDNLARAADARVAELRALKTAQDVNNYQTGELARMGYRSQTAASMKGPR